MTNTKDSQNTKDIAKGKVIGTQNTKDIVSGEKNIAKGVVAGLKNTKDIRNSQIDIVDLFLKVTVIETKLDLSAKDSKDHNDWIRTFILIVISIELVNLVLNYLLFGVHQCQP